MHITMGSQIQRPILGLDVGMANASISIKTLFHVSSGLIGPWKGWVWFIPSEFPVWFGSWQNNIKYVYQNKWKWLS